ncbi:MAG: alpha-amylase family glycosyl hydrolase [Thermoleophilia bacterium]
MARGTTSRDATRRACDERRLPLLGVLPVGGGRVEARVWAPSAAVVALDLGGRTTPLASGADGVWTGVARGAAGDDYVLVVDDEPLPDPCSRWQPRGVRGPSRVLDPGAFRWTDEGWRGVSLDDLVLYELHVGTFDEAGTFDGVVRHLDALAELGVTAIELMPVATFPGRRGWGYDGLYTWAAHEAYGGPHGLARLVDAAHAAGLGVVLDVVYNHLGPGNGGCSRSART